MKKINLKNKFVLRGTFLFLLFVGSLFPPLTMNNYSAKVYYPSLEADSDLLIDANSGVIFLENNIEEERELGTLSALPVIYLAMQKLKDNNLDMKKTEITISEKAASLKAGNPEEVSGVYFTGGSKVSFYDLLSLSLNIADSGATLALGEWTSGSEEKNVNQINDLASNLGMTNTNFTNSTGLRNKIYSDYKNGSIADDASNRSSCRDIGTLSQKLILDYPEIIKISEKGEFNYAGNIYYNRNQLTSGRLNEYTGVKGLSLGYADSSENLLGYYEHKDHKYISLVIGNSKIEEQELVGETISIYDWINEQEANFVTLSEKNKVFYTDELLDAGEKKLELYPANDIFTLKDTNLSLNLIEKEYNKKYINENGKILKTIPKGEVVLTLIFNVDENVMNFNTVRSSGEFRVDLVAENDINRSNFIQKIPDALENVFWSLYNKMF